MFWNKLFIEMKKQNFYSEFLLFINSEYAINTIFPKKEEIFKCFEFDENDLKVVIIGQDPYFNEGQANGLAFSVNENIKLPPSLKNIYKKIEQEFDVNMSDDGDLSYLKNQGVLLINKYLTVEKGKPLSHKKAFYVKMFNYIINYINAMDKTVVYLLWGNEAKKAKKLINNPKHKVIEAAHPSPLGANKGGRFDRNIFTKCNELLVENNVSPIDWRNK